MTDARTSNGGSDETMSRDEAREHLRHAANMSDADVRAYRSVVLLHNALDAALAKLSLSERRREHADSITAVACAALFTDAAGDNEHE